jgi:hypothetical protein
MPLTEPYGEPWFQYLVVLSIVVFLTIIAINIIRGRIGRQWMAIRDMDIAAELIGIRLLPTKLLAFAISSYYCGVAGAMLVFLSLGSAEVESFTILDASFPVLFMVIIGGLGSIIGSFLGAAFITILPILITTVPRFFEIDVEAATVEHLRFMIVGGLIIFFLIVEPDGPWRGFGRSRGRNSGSGRSRIRPLAYVRFPHSNGLNRIPVEFASHQFVGGHLKPPSTATALLEDVRALTWRKQHEFDETDTRRAHWVPC